MSRAERIQQLRNLRQEQQLISSQLETIDEQDDAAIKQEQRLGRIKQVRALRAVSEKAMDSEIEPETVIQEAALEAQDDSFLKDTYDVASEFAAGGVRSVADAADFVLSPLYGVSRLGAALNGQEFTLPSFRQMLAPTGTQGGYMEEGAAQDFTAALGYILPVSLGLVPVKRPTGEVRSLALDILGFGNSTLDEAAKMGEVTTRALKDMDSMKLRVPETEEEIYQAAQEAYERGLIRANRPLFEEAESRAKQIAKDMEKEGVTEVEQVDFIEPRLLSTVVDEVSKQGVDPNKVLKVIAKNKGLRFNGTIDDLINLDRTNNYGLTESIRGAPGFIKRAVLPVSDVLREHAAPMVGNLFERAAETAMRKNTAIVVRWGDSLAPVIQKVQDTPSLKAKFLDLRIKPELLDEIRSELQTSVPPEALQAFDEFIQFSQTRNARARQTLFKMTDDFDEVYIHSEKRPDNSLTGQFKQALGRYGRRDTEKPSYLQDRGRKLGSEMTEAEIAQYENPLLAHMKYLGDQEYLLEMAEKFELRPSMGKDSNVDDLFREVQRRLMADNLNADRAEGAAELMRQAYLGSKEAPPPAVRAFMSQSYMGTLAQYKTAVLNLHDLFVSMINNGFTPTLRAAMQSNRQVFGKNLTELGIGDNQAVGEFVRQFDQYMDDPDAWSKLARGASKATEVSMIVSGFKAMDRYGKGTVLRAAINKAKASAKKGTLYKDFGDLLTREELQKVQPFLKSGKKIKDAPEEVINALEELAFAALGKQQLISSAGRPLNYLKYPLARPLYALSGFAIKQGAMLKNGVYNQMKAGNYKEAAKYAARYAFYAGMGYGVLNEGREAVFKNEEFEPADILLGAVDQIVSAITLNRLGNEYSNQKFLDDPVGYTMTSFQPPTGLVGAAGKDIGALAQGEVDTNLIERFPALGDIYKYYLKEED